MQKHSVGNIRPESQPLRASGVNQLRAVSHDGANVTLKSERVMGIPCMLIRTFHLTKHWTDLSAKVRVPPWRRTLTSWILVSTVVRDAAHTSVHFGPIAPLQPFLHMKMKAKATFQPPPPNGRSYETRRFITVFTTARHRSPTESTTPPPHSQCP
jgi:hypothetical protein